MICALYIQELLDVNAMGQRAKQLHEHAVARAACRATELASATPALPFPPLALLPLLPASCGTLSQDRILDWPGLGTFSNL